MFVVRNYVTMGGTVACALAIGYLMQNGSAGRADQVEAVGELTESDQASVLAGLERITLTSSPTPSHSPTLAFGPQRGLQRAQPVPQTNCSLNARATAAPDASARLTLKAPCHQNEQVQILHSGLTFTASTDANGTLKLTVPALSEYAIFLISFGDDKGTVATTHVPDIEAFERVALQWQGETELQLHALEFGASYGDDGHVWASSESNGTGSVIHLGQPENSGTRQAQIYSYPNGPETPTGEIALSLEAEVTESNCGSALNVQTLELRGDRRLRSRDLTVTLPDCSTSEDFLVLNNLLQDLTIAAK
ncbi:hypothetical protein [Ruegeria arenilitoris]|uniref:hypothetical protein n=1 Tax=Ruegeria arenilitoris TaxID=1173585 RepID=UPI00147B8935|nr:hypothetical protein [Ruegeria arenilitoris]